MDFNPAWCKFTLLRNFDLSFLLSVSETRLRFVPNLHPRVRILIGTQPQHILMNLLHGTALQEGVLLLKDLNVLSVFLGKSLLLLRTFLPADFTTNDWAPVSVRRVKSEGLPSVEGVAPSALITSACSRLVGWCLETPCVLHLGNRYSRPLIY